MSKYHDIQKLSFQDDSMIVRVDDKEYSFPLSAISKKLLQASRQERESYEISPSGYGIHCPLIDEDLSVDGLLGIKHQPSAGRAKSTV